MAQDDADHDQEQEQVVVHLDRGQLHAPEREGPGHVYTEDPERIDAADAFGPVGNVDRVIQIVQEYADDLAESQRDDGQVVAAQFQGRRSEQHAEERRHSGRQRDHQQDRHVDPARIQCTNPGEGLAQVWRGEQGVHIRADRKKCHVAQIEQAGIPDDDVQTNRQQHIQQGCIDDTNPRIAKLTQAHRQGNQRNGRNDIKPLVVFHHVSPQARSATRSPSRPEGRNVRITISTMKAKISE